MPTNETVFNNYGTWRIEGQVDLSSAGAVSATRGDGCSTAKTGTGTYTVTVKGGHGLKLVEVLNASTDIMDAALGTVKDSYCNSVSQSTDGLDTVSFLFTTTDAAGAAADEATNALTINFRLVIRCLKMTSTL